MNQPQRAVVLLSGGMDSATSAAIARDAGFALYTLAFDYGQRHRRELESARAVSAALGAVDHRVITIDLRAFGGSALTDDIAVPHDRSLEDMGHDIPVTYVPGRNLIFLSFATAYAEVVGADNIYLGINQQDYSVSGDTEVWVRNGHWTRLMTIEDFCALPDDDYETMAVDRSTLQIEWRRVKGRFRHDVSQKRCYTVKLERGQEISITEDHSLFTINPVNARLIPIEGSAIKPEMPIVVPFDLSGCADSWSDDLASIDLREITPQRLGRTFNSSVIADEGYITNRLGKTRIPIDFPFTDDFLYIIGLWLAEGGKSLDSASSTLAFSIGGIPGAVETLKTFFCQYNVSVSRSLQNNFDCAINSSVIEALFQHIGLLGTAKRGEKRFPTFFWDLSQRQRRVLISGLWDGDGCHIWHSEALIVQKSHKLVEDLYQCLTLDGIFARVSNGPHQQKRLVMSRTRDLATFAHLYPLRHPSKLASFEAEAQRNSRDKATGLWKCAGLWAAVAAATLPVGRKTVVYNAGGKYDEGFRAQRSAFVEVPALRELALSKLAFLRVIDIQETSAQYMYDLSVEGAENFIANGILAHNSGYPDCRQEFLDAFTQTANLATKAGTQDGRKLHIHAPLIAYSKGDIVKRALELQVPLDLTWSCYEGDEQACGTCDSCLLRLKGFAEAGATDPIPYA